MRSKNQISKLKNTSVKEEITKMLCPANIKILDFLTKETVQHCNASYSKRF